MQDHSVRSDTIFHDIPDMTETPLRTLVLAISAKYLCDANQARMMARAAKGDETVSDADLVEILASIFAAPRSEMHFVEGLQTMGAAFTQARGLETEPPEDLNQSQWNRGLRDQGERLRSASLTLGAGRETIAASQLEAVSQFLIKYFSSLPR